MSDEPPEQTTQIDKEAPDSGKRRTQGRHRTQRQQ
jgi:hypothetical protein